MMTLKAVVYTKGGAGMKMAKQGFVEERFRANANLPLWREAFLGIDWLALRVSPVMRGVGVPRGDGWASW